MVDLPACSIDRRAAITRDVTTLGCAGATSVGVGGEFHPVEGPRLWIGRRDPELIHAFAEMVA